jgi:ornithine cyclodeaminase
MSDADSSILYLSSADVRSALEIVDSVETVKAALVAHAQGRTQLPLEASLRWTTPSGEAARSLALPGAVRDDVFACGIKLINASLGNAGRGLPRASGLTLLFDAETARVSVIMEGAQISAARTAAVTFLAVQALGPDKARTVAIIGAGVLARAHLELFIDRLPTCNDFRIVDLVPDRAEALALEFAAAAGSRDTALRVERTAQAAVRAADVVVPVTTATEGYIEYDWLRPGAIVVNVSLDDVLPEVVLKADRLVVDDWAIVAGDDVRLLGRMVRAGIVVGPGRSNGTSGTPRAVDAELGAVLAGLAPRRERPQEIVLMNPFGLGIEDVAVATAVAATARARGLGTSIPR